MTAYLNLRYAVKKRYEAVANGMLAAGVKRVERGFPSNGIKKGDILLTWNRIGAGNTWARRFREEGNPVIVMENAAWGNDFLGKHWYHLALDYHNTRGCFPVGGPLRWSSLGYQMQPWTIQDEQLILPQRGIGSEPTKMPANFLRKMQKRYPKARVRKHPGARGNPRPLEVDLANCGLAITWGSGAAIKALLWGVPVRSFMPNWIGEQDNTTEGRLQMFEDLAWAQWQVREIAEGTPFRRLLEFHEERR